MWGVKLCTIPYLNQWERRSGSEVRQAQGVADSNSTKHLKWNQPTSSISFTRLLFSFLVGGFVKHMRHLLEIFLWKVFVLHYLMCLTSTYIWGDDVPFLAVSSLSSGFKCIRDCDQTSAASVHSYTLPFLGWFEKLRKATVSFLMSVCLSVCQSAWNTSAPTGRIFIKFEYFFSKICRVNSSFIKIWQE